MKSTTSCSMILLLFTIACLRSTVNAFVPIFHTGFAFVDRSTISRSFAVSGSVGAEQKDDDEEEKGSAKDKVDTFRKSEFIAAVAAKSGLNKKQSEDALKAVLDVVQEQVAKGKRVNLAGFGTFTLKHRAARKGRNPQTGEELQIAASKSPGFSPAKAWKDTINNKVPAATASSTQK